MRVGAVQLTSTEDRARNMEAADRWVRAAAAQGAELVVLPEMFAILGKPEVRRAGAEPLEGPTSAWASALARELGIHLVAGSFCESVPGEARHYNTCCLFDREGRRAALYRKIHLFDCDFPGAAFHESETALPGDRPVLARVGSLRVGLTICYDLRFPELFRILALQGARVITLPAAFTERTGRDHWEVLVRARAIENQVFVIAAGQVGASSRSLRWYGRSMIVDPWGLVRAVAPDRETCLVADLDLENQATIRQTMPCLANRQPSAYHWP